MFQDKEKYNNTSLYKINLTIETLWKLGAYVVWYSILDENFELQPMFIAKNNYDNNLEFKESFKYHIVSKEQYEALQNAYYPYNANNVRIISDQIMKEEQCLT